MSKVGVDKVLGVCMLRELTLQALLAKDFLNTFLPSDTRCPPQGVGTLVCGQECTQPRPRSVHEEGPARLLIRQLPSSYESAMLRGGSSFHPIPTRLDRIQS